MMMVVGRLLGVLNHKQNRNQGPQDGQPADLSDVTKSTIALGSPLSFQTRLDPGQARSGA